MKHFTVKSPFLDIQGQDWIQPPYGQALTDQKPSLSGLRLAVKDLFHMSGLPTTAGNPTWLATHDIPSQTTSSVIALTQAGAQFCGKTITDELAYSLNGQNIHYGTPENPITPDRLPGGSSSGSAVAVSSNLADIGLGTDTGGSIRVPASYNGLFGLRPTHGAVSADNMVALAPSFDTVGWLTRDLNTLEKTAQVLLSDLVRMPTEEQSCTEAKAFPNVLIANNLIEQVAHKAEIQAQLEMWRSQGHFPNESVLSIDVNKWKTSETFRTLQGAEIWQEHGEWMTSAKPSMAPDILSRFQLSETITQAQVDACQTQRDAFTAWLESELKDAVLIIPTTPGLSPLFSTPEEELATYRNQLMNLTAISGLSGVPQLHLPVCTLTVDGQEVPCGVSLIGSKGSDLALISFAKTLLGVSSHE